MGDKRGFSRGNRDLEGISSGVNGRRKAQSLGRGSALRQNGPRTLGLGPGIFCSREGVAGSWFPLARLEFADRRADDGAFFSGQTHMCLIALRRRCVSPQQGQLGKIDRHRGGAAARLISCCGSASPAACQARMQVFTCREISSAQTITAMRILSRVGLRI